MKKNESKRIYVKLEETGQKKLLTSFSTVSQIDQEIRNYV